MTCNGEYNIAYSFLRYPDSNLGTYVRVSCNFRIEERQWLLHRVTDEPVGSHGILHDLVLATASPQAESTVEKERNQVEEQAAAICVDLCAQMEAYKRIYHSHAFSATGRSSGTCVNVGRYGSDQSQLRLNAIFVCSVEYLIYFTQL